MIRAMRASDGIVVPARQILRYLPMARAVLAVNTAGSEGKVNLNLVGESPRWSIELLENTYIDRLAGAGQGDLTGNPTGGPIASNSAATVIEHLREPGVQDREVRQLRK